MFKKFLPKEEKYFEDFREMITNIGEMAKYTQQLFSAETPDLSMILKVKPLESRCDEILNRVVKRLNKTFITPFDREDIFALIKRLDDISDMLLGAVSRVETYNINYKIQHTDKLTAIISQQIKELDTALQDLGAKRTNDVKAVKDLEREADNEYRLAIKELFAREKDAINLIKEKEILEMLEAAADKCQSTSNVILSIFIKNA
jgi:uncharacterized protein Yka (UPF0111/DUF47 family)